LVLAIAVAVETEAAPFAAKSKAVANAFHCDAAFEDLLDQRGRIDLVAEAVGVERIGQKPVIADELIDRGHLADVGGVIGAGGLDRRLGGRHGLHPGQVLDDRQIGRRRGRHAAGSRERPSPGRRRRWRSVGRLDGTLRRRDE
jgi:hypothetical protein